ncbi:MAG TPA: universal stress protein [Edaphocola sp.]|nr:universal stress protein [Edaphocola sp.]
MKHLLVPTDFSETANNAIKFAIETSKIIPSKITLLHCFEVFDNVYIDFMGLNPTMEMSHEFNLKIIDELTERLNKLKKGFEEEHKIEIGVKVYNMPLQNAIEVYSDEYEVDLVIMGTLGATGLDEKIWGSRTSAVIGSASVPVLAIPGSYKWKKPEKFLLATNNFEKDKNILNFIFEWADLYLAQVHTSIFTDEEKTTSKFLSEEKALKEYSEYLKSEYNEEDLSASHIHGKNFVESMLQLIIDKEIDIFTMITYQHGFWKRLFNPSKTKQMSFKLNIPLLAIPSNLGEKID